jgi:hypothetical protein
MQREEADFPGLFDGQAFEVVDMLMVMTENERGTGRFLMMMCR